MGVKTKPGFLFSRQQLNDSGDWILSSGQSDFWGQESLTGCPTLGTFPFPHSLWQEVTGKSYVALESRTSKDGAGVGFCVTGSPHSSVPEQDTRLTAALERGHLRGVSYESNGQSSAGP